MFLPAPDSASGSWHQETFSPHALGVVLPHVLPRSLVFPKLTPSSPQVWALCPTHDSGIHSPPSFRKHILRDFTIASNHNSQIWSSPSVLHLCSSGAQALQRGAPSLQSLHASQRNHRHHSHYSNTLTRLGYPSSKAWSYSFVHSMTHVCLISYILQSQP